MKWFIKCLKQYADFKGRARRKECFMFALFCLIFLIAAMVLDNVLGISINETGYGPISIVYIVAIWLPSLSVSVRRLHDIGKSGLWMLISLIPSLATYVCQMHDTDESWLLINLLISLISLIGGIWLLILFLMNSDSDNKYGPNPKQSE